MPDWKKIKAEYIRGVSYRRLADKYGVSFSTIQKVGAKEKWTDLRKLSSRKADEKIALSVASQEAERVSGIETVADMLLQKIMEGVKDGTLIVDTQSIRHITSSLKDLRDIKGYKSELDMQEQMARIEKLRKDATKDEISIDEQGQYGVFILPPILEGGEDNA